MSFTRMYEKNSFEVILFEGTDDEVREWIHTRAVDLGIVALPVEWLDQIALMLRVISIFNLHLAL